MVIIMSLNSYAQEGVDNSTTSLAEEKETNQNQTFRSAFDTFVNSEPQGYGIYDEKDSNVFRPGETLILYMSLLAITMEL